MFTQVKDEKMGYKFIWEDINKEIVAIKAVGECNRFIDHNYNLFKTDFYNPKTNELRSYKEVISDELDKGKCVFYKNYLIFKEGYEKEYANYVSNYVKKLSKEELTLFNSLKDKTSFSKIKSYITMFKIGVLKRPVIVNVLNENLKNNNLIEQFI